MQSTECRARQDAARDQARLTALLAADGVEKASAGVPGFSNAHDWSKAINARRVRRRDVLHSICQSSESRRIGSVPRSDFWLLSSISSHWIEPECRDSWLYCNTPPFDYTMAVLCCGECSQRPSHLTPPHFSMNLLLAIGEDHVGLPTRRPCRQRYRHVRIALLHLHNQDTNRQ